MPELNLDTAKAVVETGFRIGACEEPKDPAAMTDAYFMSVSKELIEIIEAEAANNSVHDGVLDIFHAAGIVPSSEVTRDAFLRKFPDAKPSTNGHVESEQTGAFAQITPKPPEPAAAEKPDSEDIDAIFGGVSYDDLLTDQVVAAVMENAASGALLVEEWYAILEYEKATEARKEILSLRPAFKEDEPDYSPGLPASPTEMRERQLEQQEPIKRPAYEQSSVEFFAGGAKETPKRERNLHDTVIIKPMADKPRQDNDDNVEAYYNGDTVSRAQQAGLPFPAAPEGNKPPHLPIAIDEVSSEELSRIATAYHSWFAYTQWLLAQEENRESAADHLAREAHKDAYVQAFELHKNEIPEGKVSPTAIDNARKLADKDADMAGPVRHYRALAVRHGIDARELKALASTFEKGGWRINEEMNRRIGLAKHSHTAK